MQEQIWQVEMRRGNNKKTAQSLTDSSIGWSLAVYYHSTKTFPNILLCVPHLPRPLSCMKTCELLAWGWVAHNISDDRPKVDLLKFGVTINRLLPYWCVSYHTDAFSSPYSAWNDWKIEIPVAWSAISKQQTKIMSQTGYWNIARHIPKTLPQYIRSLSRPNHSPFLLEPTGMPLPFLSWQTLKKQPTDCLEKRQS